ncbi:hypothetical protein J8281_13560 [Aquimarina sp. U1-2]|uniref:hypothetical protein n=1 Tax=Aquimarina sp. U1-2 TaxID=2823141 RepID=UPI001AECDB4D|nr:hypothetical protein [Aquimarina sp. U1-2]MBP2833215.1 hypothetical protein [Aquimarina sp. U1-2]
MKNLKLNLRSLGLIVLLFIGYSTISCNKDEVDEINPEETKISEEEFFNSLNNDPIALNYINATEKVEQTIKNAVKAKNLTPNEFREIYQSKNYDMLEEMFGNTNFLNEFEEHRIAKELFNQKYPNFQNDVLSFIPEDQIVYGNNSSKRFKFLDENIAKGCKKFSRGWWAMRSCQLVCATGGGACFLLPVPGARIACAAGAFSCATGCEVIFC